MTQTVEVIGLPRLRSTLSAAAADISDMSDAAERSARLVQTSARSRAPRLSGRLAGSLRVLHLSGGDAEIGSGLIYAPVIHNGWWAHNITPNPFLSDALDRAEVTITDYYARDIDRALAQVKGA
jgi:hypothetical protein